jgi:hypothetical protein
MTLYMINTVYQLAFYIYFFVFLTLKAKKVDTETDHTSTVNVFHFLLYFLKHLNYYLNK